MPFIANRLTNAGTLLINGILDEVSANAGSLYFDGIGDFFRIPGTQTATQFGTAAYTVECWIYQTSRNANGAFFVGGAQFTGQVFQCYINNTGNLITSKAGVGNTTASTGTVPLNAWTHIALVRTSTGANGFTYYINGQNAGTVTDSFDYNSTSGIEIGTTNSNNGGEFGLTGYMTGLRIVKGTAVYSGNFSPPSGFLDAIANTSILLNVSNSSLFLKDESLNNFTFTANGNARYDQLSPFNRGAVSITTNTILTKLSDEISLTAGSIYFDGSGDYLYATNSSSNFNYGTNNFTIEFWVYPLSGPVSTYNPTFFTNHADGDWASAGAGIRIHHNNAIFGSSSFTQINYTNNIQNNVWTHIAVVRLSGVITVYRNGIANGTANFAGTLGNNADRIALATSDRVGTGGREFPNCYISNFRIVNGTAVYTANFSPPQTILDNIQNTVFLLNSTDVVNFSKDNSSYNTSISIAGQTSWNTFSPFSRNDTTIKQRRLSTGELIVRNEFDEFTGAPVLDNSLQVFYDAAQPASYSGSGTTITDLSGKSNSGSLITIGGGTITFTTAYGGGWAMTSSGTTVGGAIGAPYSLPTTQWTVEMVCAITLNSFWSSIWGSDVYNGNGWWAIYQSAGSMTVGAATASAISSAYTFTTNNINTPNHWIWVHTGSVIQLYRNGILISPSSGSYTSPSAPANIGTVFGARHQNGATLNSQIGDCWPGTIYLVRMYNKALSADEANQNFISIKSRYGL